MISNWGNREPNNVVIVYKVLTLLLLIWNSPFYPERLELLSVRNQMLLNILAFFFRIKFKLARSEFFMSIMFQKQVIY